MIILLLALIFGIVVGLFTVKSLTKGKENGDKRKAVRIIKFVVLGESAVFIVLFLFVIFRTLIM